MKHAILIMAHANFSQLKLLVSLLDYEEFDLYIHINSKSSNWKNELIENSVFRANLYFVKRVAVSYCDYSQVEAIKSLLQESTSRGYDYYHIISGADLPLMRHDDFLDFFRENNGKEFVGFAQKVNYNFVRHYWFLSNLRRTASPFISKILIWQNKLMQNLQSFCRINVVRGYNGKPRKGYDWWSITHAAAVYVLEKEPEFKSFFKYAYCPSEWLVQTILYNSHFKENLYDTLDQNRGSMRNIDWQRGTPYVWKEADFEYLINSKYLFGRKFDSNIDERIIIKLKKFLTSEL